MSQQLYVKETPWKQYSLEKMITAAFNYTLQVCLKNVFLAKLIRGFMAPSVVVCPTVFAFVAARSPFFN